MERVVLIQIPRSELKEYKDYLGFIFKNENGVLNICNSEDDIFKSNQWFKNMPYLSYVVSDDEFFADDKILTFATNKELDGKIFTYKGLNKQGIDLIDLESENGEKVVSTIHLLSDALKIEREANPTDKRSIVNGKVSVITIYNE